MAERSRIRSLVFTAAMVAFFVGVEPLEQVLVEWGIPRGWKMAIAFSVIFISVGLLVLCHSSIVG
jgi:hypothetical protein